MAFHFGDKTEIREAPIQTLNPATEETLRIYPSYDAAQIDAALDLARRAFSSWRSSPLAERTACLQRIASRLRAEKTHIATLITTEMGKPILEAEAEVEKCAWGCEHYAEHASEYLADQIVTTAAKRSLVAFRPLGVILAIMPWNFPFWQVFRAAAPILAAGNALILKHASNVTGCALEIERLCIESGLPKGLLTPLVLAGHDMEPIIADPRIAAVTLTGSEAAGSSVAAIAAKHLKKAVLELGGSDAFIVLADADIDEAAKTGARSRFLNAGQSCIAAKRFIVEDAAYDDFALALIEHAKKLVIGNPLDRATQLGPLARADLRKEIERQIQASLRLGAMKLLGAQRPDRPGYYYEPSILGNVSPAMPLFAEETFGPAAALTRARDAEQALELANASPFGLGGSLWTRDRERGERLAARLESGSVFINGMTISDPRLPFGGVKRSGYGRELSHFGIQEFVNVQTVWID